MDKDVTIDVRHEAPDDEFLPITKCVCGATFSPWNFVISIYAGDEATECPECHRTFYFRQTIRVYQVEEWSSHE